MSTKIAERRRARRYAVAPASGARVELPDPTAPADAEPCRLPLLDFSPAGLSFRLPEGCPIRTPDIGASLAPSSICIGPVTIRGELVVMHVSARGEGLVCGALFYPDTDDDLVKMKSVVAGIQAATAG